jgi:hypothetical protein
VLPLAGYEFVMGAESAGWTGEPHALPGPADPMDQRSPGVPHWSGDQARTTPSTSRRVMSSGRATVPTSGRDLNWAGRPRNQRPADH